MNCGKDGMSCMTATILHYPIRLSFAMTIKKAQGQNIANVGIYLPEPVISHNQLYVALSRDVSRKTTWVLAKPNKDIDPTRKRTKNIVYWDVLEALKGKFTVL